MKLRAMHVTPSGVSRVWDIILMDDRQNARIFMNQEGTEFMDLVILEGGGLTQGLPTGTPRQYKNDEFVTSLEIPKTVSVSDNLDMFDLTPTGAMGGYDLRKKYITKVTDKLATNTKWSW